MIYCMCITLKTPLVLGKLQVGNMLHCSIWFGWYRYSQEVQLRFREIHTFPFHLCMYTIHTVSMCDLIVCYQIVEDFMMIIHAD